MATIETKIEAAERRAKEAARKLDQLKAQQALIEARKLQSMLKGQRAEDTRRKILVGAAILAKVDRGEWPREKLLVMLDAFLTRADDRALFDLPVPSKPE